MATSTQVIDEQRACGRSATRTSSFSVKRTCGTSSRNIQLPEYDWSPLRSKDWKNTRERRSRRVSPLYVYYPDKSDPSIIS
ncbi:hypothetical protein HZH66_009829 [Vespula vulgaris]|uniref:Uncharacterized protein n=1 Tax=Vespula vulgaris TaxID=7454 RepID=A0A834JR16_VESVU|nr:hypothetical protein HZH66_009829 [Vespula vulgaris]